MGTPPIRQARELPRPGLGLFYSAGDPTYRDALAMTEESVRGCRGRGNGLNGRVWGTRTLGPPFMTKVPPAAAPAFPEVRVRPSSYQPKKAELEDDVSVDASPEEARAALMRSVTIKEDPDA